MTLRDEIELLDRMIREDYEARVIDYILAKKEIEAVEELWRLRKKYKEAFKPLNINTWKQV